MSVIAIIVAMSKNRVIGSANTIPWHISEDLIRTRKLTMGHPVIMGRKTHESISGFTNLKGWEVGKVAEHKTLPGRTNIVITTQAGYKAEGCLITHDIEEAIKLAENSEGGDEIFIIGGGSVYEKAMPLVDKIYLTLIDREVKGDTYFPEKGLSGLMKLK